MFLAYIYRVKIGLGCTTWRAYIESFPPTSSWPDSDLCIGGNQLLASMQWSAPLPQHHEHPLIYIHAPLQGAEETWHSIPTSCVQESISLPNACALKFFSLWCKNLVTCQFDLPWTSLSQNMFGKYTFEPISKSLWETHLLWQVNSPCPGPCQAVEP